MTDTKRREDALLDKISDLVHEREAWLKEKAGLLTVNDWQADELEAIYARLKSISERDEALGKVGEYIVKGVEV